MRIDYFLMGIIIGIGKIIPGLSGTIMMISFGLYDKAINAITNFFMDVKNNLLFLLNIGLGIIIGIIMFSKIINYFITNYYIYTTSLFVGLVMGSIPIIYRDFLKSKKGYLLAIMSFIIMFIINNIRNNGNYIVKGNYMDVIVFFISGILEAIGTIVPGVSSTLLLMLMGVYNIYLDILASIFNLNVLANVLWFLIPFSIGMIISIIVLSKLINYLFIMYKKETYSVIMGIIISTSFLIILRLINTYRCCLDIFMSFILLLVGFYIGKKI